MRSFLRKLELGYWTYGLLSVLGRSSQNLVFMPQALKTPSTNKFRHP